eukprot:scaffold84899_cov63-Phaeocystis_antarctica.AAC.2
MVPVKGRLHVLAQREARRARGLVEVARADAEGEGGLGARRVREGHDEQPTVVRLLALGQRGQSNLERDLPLVFRQHAGDDVLLGEAQLAHARVRPAVGAHHVHTDGVRRGGRAADEARRAVAALHEAQL